VTNFRPPAEKERPGRRGEGRAASAAGWAKVTSPGPSVELTKLVTTGVLSCVRVLNAIRVRREHLGAFEGK
jgi:hypothetical protein